MSKPKTKFNNFLIAIKYNDVPTLIHLLNDPEIDPGAQDNRAIINASRHSSIEIVKLLLDDPRVDPSAKDNQVIINAMLRNNIEIIKLLLNDPRVDPSTRDNLFIVNAAKHYNSGIVKLLLNDPRVDPSAQNNEAIINALLHYHIKNVQLLLNDPRVDPSAQNSQAIRRAVAQSDIEMIELLLNDPRVDPEYMRNAKSRQSKVFFNKRKEIDSYFGLITDTTYYKDKPIDILKFALSNSDYLTATNINYIFMCLNQDQFNEVMLSDISDEDMSMLLSYVKRIRCQVPIECKRNLCVVFNKIGDVDFLTNNILIHKHLLSIFMEKDLGTDNSFKIYRKYGNKFPLIRDYNIIDVVFRRDKSELYRYVLTGKYLPYIQHEDSELWIELPDSFRTFTETFMFTAGHHVDYTKSLGVESKRVWRRYINDDTYQILNGKLRDGKDFTPIETEWYTSLNTDIIKAPRLDKLCVLYRGISIDDEFRPGVDTYGANTFTWKAFSSCSSIREISDQFRETAKCCLFVIIAPIGAVLLDITPLKNSEHEIVLPPGAIMKYLGSTGEANIVKNADDKIVVKNSIIVKYIGYETDNDPFYFESEEERNKTLDEEMKRFDIKF